MNPALRYTRLVPLVLAIAPAASADVVQNGDFSSGLDHWTSQGPVSAVFLGAPVNSHAAYFPGSGRLWQTFTLPPGAVSYSFDYAIIHVNDPGDTGPPLFDAFNAFILDAATLDSIVPAAPGFEGVPAFMIAQMSGLGAVNTDYVTVVEPDLANSQFGHVTVNLAALPQPLPPSVRVEFGIAVGDDGFRLDLIIDNVTVIVPAPGGAMALGGLFALTRRHRNRESPSRA